MYEIIYYRIFELVLCSNGDIWSKHIFAQFAFRGGGLLDVVGGPGGGVAEDELLGHAPAHGVDELVEQLVAGGGVLVVAGHDHGVAQGLAARQDRHLGDRVGVGAGGRAQGVAGLVVGGDGLLVLVHDAGALLGASDDAVDGLVQGPVKA